MVDLQAYPSAFQPTLLAAALPAAGGSPTASLLSLAGAGGVAAATPTRLAIAATNGHHQPQGHLAAQLAPSPPSSSSPSAWNGGLAACVGGGSLNWPCSTLFVANLGHSCTETQLMELFQRYVPRFASFHVNHMYSLVLLMLREKMLKVDFSFQAFDLRRTFYTTV